VRLRSATVLIIVLLFLAVGLAFIRKAGLHFDASYELASFYSCSFPAFRATLFGYQVPVMVIQYLGAFKSWLYHPILTYLEPTLTALRLPLLLVGAGSIWLCYLILERIAGRRAAVGGSLLLATDASYVIVTTYDFGPVVFLHFFLLAGIALLLRFDRNQRTRDLALAFFLFGLALWHKALFLWMLGGLVVASAIVVHERIRQLLSARRTAIALGAFCLGAVPLIYYNVVSRGATLHSENVMSGNAPLSQKVRILKRTLDGSVFFGWLTEESRPETAAAPSTWNARAAVYATKVVGRTRSNAMLYAVLASCALIPWLWSTPSRKAAMFVFAYLLAVWGLMALLPNTGATVHHAILLWPFPQMLVAIAGAQLSYRFPRYGPTVAAAALALITASNAILLNQYYADLTTEGTTVIWTDAVHRLAGYLETAQPSKSFITVDWGYSATLCLLSDGELPRYDLSYLLLQPSDSQKAWVAGLIANPANIFIDHAEDGTQFLQAREHLRRIAEGAGYRRQVVAHIPDRNQRTRFEIFRYVPAP
jgi:Dolichyl-phosphate-mannose-protein mannosyltransferase